ncbi:MAG: colanic acid biosynthesis acetyltransferase WcaF [Blastopirellula sp.]|nr:colanic acid biosynthesis acetyltransferase WcaF [Blastopirellula sp.]
MTVQDLHHYAPPSHWQRGPLIRRLLWLVIVRPLVASWMPGTIWRKAILRAFGARIGKGGRIKPRVCITAPWNLRIGNYCWLGEELWIDNLAEVVIGDQVCLSQGVYLCTGNHDYRRRRFDLRLAPITVEAETWIAAKAVLAPGTHVRARAVVSLASVVSGAVPEGAIVRGNPARVVGQR